MLIYLLGAIDALAVVFLLLGFGAIPGPEWLKGLIVLLMIYKAAVSFFPR